jgi:nucleotide-binding universal stress UspA family protein
MIQHILFATDGSLSAEHAEDYVASFAMRFHSKVTVLHAFIHLPEAQHEYTFPNNDSYAFDEDVHSLIERIADRLRGFGVKEVNTEVVSGQPASVILGVAETIKPDLIIVGARGVGTWQGLLLGSTSMSVVQRAEIPVLVVK